MEGELIGVYAAALDSMRTVGPNKLGKRVANEAQLIERGDLATIEVLLDSISGEAGDNRLVARLRQEFAQWDATVSPDWAGTTNPKTPERRELIYKLLELEPKVRERLEELLPIARSGGGVLIGTEFKPWYVENDPKRPALYWRDYEAKLLQNGWGPDAVADLGAMATSVVERLADPQREEAYQAKGLVVGYVQSGKTANFTGVIAKAIDAGYRLIIVLTGTTDLLRTQTQRRLDKELVGKENLLNHVDVDDPEALESVDYYGDPDWDDFVEHGGLPSDSGLPNAYRLTTRSGDYKSLKQGIEALDFIRVDETKPLIAVENLNRVPARIAVVKKNSSVLAKLVKDLKKINAKLEHIPALIIDDESDQASINTSDPKKWEASRRKRTAINRHISDLLGCLHRGQYVGYTATPFANVFVDPTDADDIFPRDFILSLDRPSGYMGALEFHDLEPVEDPEDLGASNEKAYVRSVYSEFEEESLAEAIDAFVLTGAVKLWRSEKGSAGSFEHHTMLVHQSVRQAVHSETAELIKEVWAGAGWYTAAARDRLAALYSVDFGLVMAVRNDGEPVPSFDELAPYIARAASKISGADGKPVWIINGDKEVAEHDLDFNARGVWKIMVGGAKLSRGFTIEGLTVSFYSRITRQADTLMQMGRWFGFRRGYKDLVRLYIGRATQGSPLSDDLYLSFEGACRSEEAFRKEIRRYSEMVDGKPQITPSEVPPLVAQYVPWLKPAAANKMYNVELAERRSPGSPIEPTGYPSDAALRAKNADSSSFLVETADDRGEFLGTDGKPYGALLGKIGHSELVAGLREIAWAPSDHFSADLEWLAKINSADLEDWVVIFPQLKHAQSERTIFGKSMSAHLRRRREGRALFGAISDPKHRLAAERIAGVSDCGDDSLARSLHQERRGAMLVYPMFEATTTGEEVPLGLSDADISFAFTLLAPPSTGSPDSPLILFRPKDDRYPEQVIELP